MKLLLDIKDDKAPFFLELLKNFPFVKAKQLSTEKATKIEGLKEAIDQVNQHKEGKTQLKPARELLDEL